MDNTSAIAYINHMGGTRSSNLAKRSIEFWEWALERGIILRACHIAGVENTVADQMSTYDRTDWQLNPKIFSKINDLWGPIQVDMFAMRLSALLPRFYSWRPEPLVEATDAFSQNWNPIKGYANPPWSLIQCCLKKVFTWKRPL